jgi:SNF2 family DNA or RNA helicase
VDRAFRIGQRKDVVVYRLIMASSVEEKMYEKQVFKDGVRVVTECGSVSSARYFSKDETSELFKVGPAGTLVH